MRRIWLLFTQTVTVCLAILFVVVTLRPEWLHRTSPSRARLPSSVGQPPGPSPVTMPVSFADAVSIAAPAVVNIHTTKKIISPRIVLPPDPLLKHFFEQLPGFNQQRQMTSLGSGVLVSAEGYILTNLHVIDGADEILVALNDGRQSTASVVGVDTDTDLAVLQVKLAHVPVLSVATGDLPRVGDVVLAIGNPFGVGQTITMGIISALGRGGLGLNTYENFIQTDAAINPGNSGGALIDTQGRLIGINTAIYSKSGGSLGIGFAVPASAALQIYDEIVKQGYVKRGWLGIEPQDMTADLARAFKLEPPVGVIIAGVLRDGPAARGGLRIGDIVQSIDGSPVENTARLMARIASKMPGDRIELEIFRNASRQKVDLVVSQRPVRPQ